MKIVLDTNVLISALIKDSFTRSVLFYSGFNFYYPEISLKEINKYKKLILKKSGLSKNKFDELFSSLLKKINVVPSSFFEDSIGKSKKVMEKIDVKDTVFVALALRLDAVVWSDDLHFDKQNLVKNIKSNEVVKSFMKNNLE
jgi:predicted nucleic acid-binding protein